jgi:hypothetical protein
MSVISTAGAATDGLLFWLWGIAAIVWVIAILAAIGFAFAREGQVAAGVLAGVGIGAIALAATCFANLSMAQF